MKIAITGGTGFVGRNLAKALVGHDVVPVSRRVGVDVTNEEDLARAFQGCDAVAHCAGINREIGDQTYRRVHVEGTRAVVRAAKRAGARKVTLLSFLRARPDCGLPYHESKWAAEEIVRNSGLDYTIVKAGVIYGRGDHMLDHLSHAFHTFPIFGLVGLHERLVAPLAVEDAALVLKMALIDGALPHQTVALIGPEQMTLGEAVRRVAHVVGKVPRLFRLPIAGHLALGWLCERVMKTPLISLAQVRILSESLVEPGPGCVTCSIPTIRFSDGQIRKGLPEPGAFGLRDLRCQIGRL